MVVIGMPLEMLFQSLKGISAFWNMPVNLYYRSALRFNPSKGYRHFGTFIGFTFSPIKTVSIPQRDIGILELKLVMILATRIPFQSLKGISAFWNELGERSIILAYDTFQSLKGISAFWNMILLLRIVLIISFNPSKGYRHFGTEIDNRSAEILRGFNPSKGYRHFGTMELMLILTLILCFNPSKGYRHFGTKFKRSHSDRRNAFQSLKGISAFWNFSIL